MGWGDSSDSSNSDDEGMMERRMAKRARGWAERRDDDHSPPPTRPPPPGPLPSDASQDAPLAPPTSPVPHLRGGKARKNAVWADVLNEQTLTAELSKDVGVRSGNKNEMVARDVESFPLPPQLANKGFTQPPYENKKKGKSVSAAVAEELDMELDAYKEAGPSASADPFADDHTTVAEPLSNVRKRPAKQRGGRGGWQGNRKKLVPIHIPKLDLDPALSPILLAGKLAEALKEPKKELIERVVNECGAVKAIELYHRTQKIQSEKGLTVADKSRLRSPGGVLLYLLREDTSIEPSAKQGIFSEDKDKQRKFSKVKRRSKVPKSYEEILAETKRAMEAAAKAKASVSEEPVEESMEEEREEGEMGSDEATPSPLGDIAPEAPEIPAI